MQVANDVFDAVDPGKVRDLIGYTNVHVDFHTPEYVTGVGRDFDAEAFAEMMKSANVDSITFFASCYHGYSYYNTRVGVKHPGLEKDLLEDVVRACHKRGIRVFAYLSVALNVAAGKRYPTWVQRDSKGSPLVDAKLAWMCLNSPYTETVLMSQVKELVHRDLDGFFFDELFYHPKGCFCAYCTSNMAALGLSPESPQDLQSHVRLICERTAMELSMTIRQESERADLVVLYNPSTTLLGVMGTLSKLETSVLVGGHEAGWSGIQLPMYYRYVRNLGKPVMAMTAIFHRVWGDFGSLKHPAQLSFECAEQLAHHFRISIGDHQRPRGELDRAKYKLIGQIFQKAKALKLPPADPVRDTCIVVPGEKSYSYLPAIQDWRDLHVPASNGATGSTKLLCETHVQFDVLDEEMAESLLPKFKLAILPETGTITPRAADAIRSFVSNGGALLATGTSSLRDGVFALEEVLGVHYNGRYLNYGRGYFDLKDFKDSIPDLDFVSYDNFLDVSPLPHAEVKATVTAPMGGGLPFTASFQGPPDVALHVPAIVYTKYGKGEVVYVGTNIFTQYHNYSYYAHRTLISNIIRRIHKEPVITVDAPSNIWVNLMETEESVYVHILNYHADFPGSVFPRITGDPPPVPVKLEVRTKGKKVVSLTNAEFTAAQTGKGVMLSIPAVRQHEIFMIT